MSIEILDCLKRKRDSCIKNMIPSQNTAFMWIPALIIEEIDSHRYRLITVLILLTCHFFL